MYHDLLARRMPLWFALKDDEFVSGKRFETLINYLAKNFRTADAGGTACRRALGRSGSACSSEQELAPRFAQGRVRENLWAWNFLCLKIRCPMM